SRGGPEFRDVIGRFANRVPMRADLSGDPTFTAFLARVRTRALEDYAHVDLPFERLVEELKPPRDASRNPVFQIGFVLQNSPWPDVPRQDVVLLNGDTGSSRFDLTLQLQDQADELHGSFEYSTDLFERATLERMSAQFEVLASEVTRDPDRRLSELPLMSPAERARIVSTMSVGPRIAHRPACVHDLIAARVHA